MSKTLFGQPFNNCLLCIGNLKSVKEAAVYKLTGCNIGKCCLLYVAAGNNLNNRKVKFLCKFPVTLIVCRNCHDGAGTVSHEYIVANPNRNLLAVYRIDGTDAVKKNTGLLFRKLGTLKIGLPGSHLTISRNVRIVIQTIPIPVNQRMLRRNYHIGSAKQGIRTGCIYGKLLVNSDKLEINLRTLGTANPVFLGNLNLLDVIDLIQIVNQLLCILGNLEHPLAFNLTDNLASAALTYTVNNLFVGKTDLTGGTPVNRHLRLIRKSLLEKLQENPLRPLIVPGIGGIYLSAPVKGVAKALQLLLKTSHIVCSNGLRMNFILNCVVLGRETKCIPSHRIKNIIPLHTALSCYNIKSGIRSWMTYMKALSGRIRELNQRIVLRLRIIGTGYKCLLLIPDILPFFLNLFRIVIFTHF